MSISFFPKIIKFFDLFEKQIRIVEETEKMLLKLGSKKEVTEHSKNIIKIKNESELQLLIALGELYDSDPTEKERLLQVIMSGTLNFAGAFLGTHVAETIGNNDRNA
jgi:hypothetical protein